jgi:hypothetical protein
MKKELFRYIAVASLIVLFSVIVYPTPYEFQKSGSQIIKINRITGSAYVLNEKGWDIIDGK